MKTKTKAKSMAYEIPTCKKCGDEYHLPDGYDATDYCNPCAQELVVELLAALEDIAEPLKKIQADAGDDQRFMLGLVILVVAFAMYRRVR
jgi:hypothetical protein